MVVMEEKKRLYWVDNARAAAMISMVVYHTMWDLVYLYGMKADWYHGDMAFVWQQSICWTFILLAGFCSRMTRNPLRQGLIVSFWGIVVMAVTQIFMPGNGVWFGVLTLIGSCYLVMALLKQMLNKVHAWSGLICSAVCFVLTYHLADGSIGAFGMTFLRVPRYMYANLFTAYLGFPQRGFFSTDYFPIFPWMFLFFCGVFAYSLWAKYRPRILENCDIRIPVLSRMGHFALVIYVLHQPIIYGVLEVIYFWRNKTFF